MNARKFLALLTASGAVVLATACTEMSKVMKSDASFSEKVKQFGGIVGRQFDQQSGTRADAVKKHNYAGRADLLEIDSAVLAPEVATPGSTVESTVHYTVLVPNDAQQVKVAETRTLVSEHETVHLSSREVSHDQGTQLTRLKFTLPNDLARGRYTLVTTLSSGRNKTTARNVLRVI
jgi:hypothetical protein